MNQNSKEITKALTVFLTLIVILFISYRCASPIEIDLSVRQQDDVETLDWSLRQDFKIYEVQNKFRWDFYRTSEFPSRADLSLNTYYPLQDINFAAKIEYYKEDFRRNRFGFGVSKRYEIFGIDQFLTKEFIHRGDDNLLFDTSLFMEYSIEKFKLSFRYSFLTNFDSIDYKYIRARAEEMLNEVIGLALETDRRWEEKKKEITKLVITVRL